MPRTFVARIRAFTPPARHKGVEERPSSRAMDGRLRPYVFAGYVAAVLLVLPALAHGPADWIMQGQHKNAAGEWCCGEGDCFVVTGVATVTTPAPGYRLPGSIREDGRERPDVAGEDGRERPDVAGEDGRERPDGTREDGRERPDGEFIPQSEAQPSPDGQFWRCRRPDGSRRCFFAPPPNS